MGITRTASRRFTDNDSAIFLEDLQFFTKFPNGVTQALVLVLAMIHEDSRRVSDVNHT